MRHSLCISPFFAFLWLAIWWPEFPTKIHAKLDPDSLVQVYDGVLNSDAASWLHEECIKWDKGTFVNIFPLKEPERHIPIAQFLDRLLHQLYPGTTEPKYYVETWQRSEWYHVFAHADMDEGWERQTNDSPSTPLRHPETGHVLYLQVGRHVRGPTVLWNVTKGGELVGKDASTEMITVPAVPGRLLRFQGNALHSVPRPAEVYWTLEGDDEAPYRQDSDQRSVLLFNLWPVEQGMLVDHEAMNGTDTGSQIPDYATCKPAQEWTAIEPVAYREHVEPWTEYMYRVISSTYYEAFWIPLMGDNRRRGMSNRAVRVESHYGVRDAFRQKHQPTAMTVQSPKKRIFGFEL